MPIDPISAGVQGLSQLAQPQAPTPSAGFADAIKSGLQAVSDAEHAADAAIEDFATGGETSVHDLMVQTSKAQLSVELLAQVRDRAVESYQEIMRMQV